jgi:hypothetical protein
MAYLARGDRKSRHRGVAEQYGPGSTRSLATGLKIGELDGVRIVETGTPKRDALGRLNLRSWTV